MGRRTLLLIASILVAALGTALIWLYVQGADTRAQEGEVQVQVLVSATSLKAGDPASNVKPVARRFPQSVVAGFGGGVLDDPTKIKGYAKTDIVAGTPLLAAQFGDTPTPPPPLVSGLAPDQVAMQVTLPDPQRLAGLLQPGSKIRVYAGIQSGNSNAKGAIVLFNQVTVLASGPVTDTSGTVKGSVPQAIVTLALNNGQAKQLVYAQNNEGGSAALWFGLLGANVPKDDGSIVQRIQPGEY